MIYCAGKLIENLKLFYKSDTRKACKSLAFGSGFTSFSRVLPTSRVGYHAVKPIENVVYCLNISVVVIYIRSSLTTVPTP